MTAALVLLDSASLYFRSFYALPQSLTAPDGTPVNAVRGFLDTLAKVLTEQRPHRMVACLDADWRPAFRVAALPSYKAHRVVPEGDEELVPDTLSPQVPIILDVLEAAGLAIAEAEGYEADDVIGTLATSERIDPVEVITGDRDLFQLVRNQPTPVTVRYVGRGWAKAEVLGTEQIAERYGLPIDNAGSAYADMAVLRGDPSDGLPGVPGVGEKTAAKLISDFGSLPDLLAAVSEANDHRLGATMRLKLTKAVDYLSAANVVVRIATDAPVKMDRPDMVPTAPQDLPRLRELQQRWGLSGSMDRLISALGASTPTAGE